MGTGSLMMCHTHISARSSSRKWAKQITDVDGVCITVLAPTVTELRTAPTARQGPTESDRPKHYLSLLVYPRAVAPTTACTQGCQVVDMAM